MRHQSIIGGVVKNFRPKSVVELGPGDSLGVGCAALLSGADRYIGLDIVSRARPEHDVRVLDELVALFEQRPHDGSRTIRIDRAWIELIRTALRERSHVFYDNVPVGYIAPWNERSVDRKSTDLVITQGVLHYLAHDDRGSKLAESFSAMAKWLRPGGVMSHEINFAFRGGAYWNHHWRHSDAAWRVIQGVRPFFENRVSLSTYLSLCAQNGVDVVSVKRVEKPAMPRELVAPRFRDLPEEDFRTASAHIVAIKR
jgi:hypothetical protein